MRLWPIFPGLVISYLVRPLVPHSWIPGGSYLIGSGVTVMFLAGLMVSLHFLRPRISIWLSGIFALSSALAFVGYLMTKA